MMLGSRTQIDMLLTTGCECDGDWGIVRSKASPTDDDTCKKDSTQVDTLSFKSSLRCHR